MLNLSDIDSVNSRRMILKTHHTVERNCRTFTMRERTDEGKDRVRPLDQGDLLGCYECRVERR